MGGVLQAHARALGTAHGRSGLQRLSATLTRSLLPPSATSAPSWDVPGGGSSLLTISPLDLTLTLSLFMAHRSTSLWWGCPGTLSCSLQPRLVSALTLPAFEGLVSCLLTMA